MTNDTILLLAMLADFFIKIPQKYHLTHPVIVVGRGINWFDAKYNQPHKNDMLKMAMGGVMVMVLSGLGLIFASLIENMPLIGVGGQVFLVYVLLAHRSLIDHIKNIAKPLQNGDLAVAQTALQMVVSRDATKCDQYMVARSALESLGENFNDAVVAPIFWYILLGINGLVLFKIVSTIDSMVGYHNQKYEYFGKIGAIFDDILNYIPARITSGLFILCAPFLGQSITHTFKITLRDGRNHASPNAGYCEAAFAGALGVQLGGERYYDGIKKDNRYGDGNFACTAPDIMRGIQLCNGIYGFILAVIILFIGLSFVW